MWHPLIDVTAFRLLGSYKIWVKFQDNHEAIVDLEPVLGGELFGPLRDPLLFNQVQLDAETGTLVWPNGADFDPWTLHEWPAVVDELTERAKLWELVPAGRA